MLELNSELRPNTIFKQPTSAINQQVRSTAPISVPSTGLSSS
jgi:hypothetical protein